MTNAVVMDFEVFPARAGMSRRFDDAETFRLRVPRASGDEPRCNHVRGSRRACSPRERG